MAVEQGILLKAASLGADVASVAVNIEHITRMSLHLILTGTPVGAIQLQCSNDPVADGDSVINWIDYTDGVAAVSGAMGVMFNLKEISFKWIRVIYVRSSGTGAITCNTYSVTDRA